MNSDITENDDTTEDTTAQGIYYALLDLYGEEIAVQVENSDAHGALVYRVRQLGDTGAHLSDVFDDMSADEARFLPAANDSAAYLASRVTRYIDTAS